MSFNYTFTVSTNQTFRGPGQVKETDNPTKDTTNFEAEIKLDFQEKVTVILPLECKPQPLKEEQLCETVKEKQCWDMYQKMAERGQLINYNNNHFSNNFLQVLTYLTILF